MEKVLGIICRLAQHFKGSQGVQWVQNPPAMQEILETWVPSLGQEDPLEEEMAPTPVFLPGGSHGQRSLAGYSPWGRAELDTTEHARRWHIKTAMRREYAPCQWRRRRQQIPGEAGTWQGGAGKCLVTCPPGKGALTSCIRSVRGANTPTWLK